MPAWIAVEPVVFVDIAGHRVHGRISIGAPEEVPAGGGVARCAVRFEGIVDKVEEVTGDSALHALVLGLRFAAGMLHSYRTMGYTVVDPADDSVVALETLFGPLYAPLGAY